MTRRKTQAVAHIIRSDEGAAENAVSSPSGLVVGVGALAVYLATVAPGIPGGDAGEVVAESCHLGTAHPPGYPLFTLLNHVTTRGLPRLLDMAGLRPGPGVDGRASPAWCANATTSVMGALAVVFTAQTTNLLLCARRRDRAGNGNGDRQQRQQVEGERRSQHVRSLPPDKHVGIKSWWWNKSDDETARLRELASGCAALLMAFSPLTWQYSVTAEVFALNNFLLSLLCSLTARFSFHRDLNTAMGGALVSGLALSNQHTAVLYVAPLAGWVMLQLVTSRCRQFNAAQSSRAPWRGLFRDTVLLAGSFFLGLTPYAFLPLAANLAPKPGSWGNVATLWGLLHHVRRGDYGSLRLYSGKVRSGGDGSQDCLERLRIWFSDLSSAQGLGGVVPALATLGLLYLLLFAPRKEGGVGGRGGAASVVASGATSAPEKNRSSPGGCSHGPLEGGGPKAKEGATTSRGSRTSSSSAS
eukprot:g6246.t2